MAQRLGTGASVSRVLLSRTAELTVHLCEILASIPLERSGKEPRALVNPVESTKLRAVGIEDNAICARLLDANPIVCKALLVLVST